MEKIETNYETYLVINQLREEHDYVDDIIQLVNEQQPVHEIVKNLQEYVEKWLFKGDMQLDYYPLHKALWLSAYRQVDWMEVMKCFKYGSETWAIKDDEK